jgi:GH25 family lysozyme M1 (1,4-beta-N-acetylmuramidase)
VTDPEFYANPQTTGTAEHAEWATIAAAPHWHGRGVPKRKGTLAQLAEQREQPAVDDGELGQHAQQLEQLAAAGVVFGPDVSQYQGRPDWAAVKASGHKFALYKVSEGRTFADPSCAYNRAAIPAAGLAAGGYHYLYFSAEYADKPALWGAQADWFARNVGPGHGHVVDVEDAATAGAHLGVKEWVSEYRKLFPDHPLIGYLNKSLWRNRSRIPYDPADLFDAVWHAGVGDGFYTGAKGTIAQEWAATPKLTNSVASIGYPVVELWQITDHAVVPGVTGTCDGNAYLGSAAELASLFTGVKIDPPVNPPVDPPKPPTVFPAFPLPLPHRREAWFGPGGVTSGGGFSTWQRRMRSRGWPIVVDGQYGPQSAHVARAFQTEKHLPVDALIGKRTWDAAWTSKVTG